MEFAFHFYIKKFTKLNKLLMQMAALPFFKTEFAYWRLNLFYIKTLDRWHLSWKCFSLKSAWILLDLSSTFIINYIKILINCLCRWQHFLFFVFLFIYEILHFKVLLYYQKKITFFLLISFLHRCRFARNHKSLKESYFAHLNNRRV